MPTFVLATAAAAAIVNAVTVTFPIQIVSDVNAWMQQIWLLFTSFNLLQLLLLLYLHFVVWKGHFQSSFKERKKERKERRHLMVYFRFVCQLSFFLSFSRYRHFNHFFYWFSFIFWIVICTYSYFLLNLNIFFIVYLNRCWICSP